MSRLDADGLRRSIRVAIFGQELGVSFHKH
jgi:hypothetical protein